MADYDFMSEYIPPDYEDKKKIDDLRRRVSELEVEKAKLDSEPSAEATPDVAWATLVQLGRLYDLNLAILSVFDQEKAVKLVEAHAAGELFCPDVTLKYEEQGNE